MDNSVKGNSTWRKLIPRCKQKTRAAMNIYRLCSITHFLLFSKNDNQ